MIYLKKHKTSTLHVQTASKELIARENCLLKEISFNRQFSILEGNSVQIDQSTWQKRRFMGQNG